MSFGIPVRNGLAVGLLASTFLSSLRIGGRPAMFLDFIGTNSLDSRITFTRSTTATFVGSNGLIQSAAIDAPRFDYNPTTLAPKGLLMEEQRINSIVNSTLDGGTTGSPGTPPTNWTQSTTGTATGTYALDTELAFTGYTYKTQVATSGRLMALQVISVSANTSYYVSVTVDITSGSEQILNYFGVASLPVGATQAYYFDGSPVASSYVPTAGRHTFAILITVAGTAGVAQIRMGVGTFFGATAAANITYRRPQFEAGVFPTSYIPTTVSQATRARDIALMTGTNFSSWYNQTQGTFVATFDTSVLLASSLVTVYTILSANDQTSNNSMDIYAYSNFIGFNMRTGGSPQADLNGGGSPTNNAIIKAASAYAVNNVAASVNSAAPATDNLATIPTTNQFSIGMRNTGGTSSVNGHIRSIAYYNTRLPDATLRVLSA